MRCLDWHLVITFLVDNAHYVQYACDFVVAVKEKKYLVQKVQHDYISSYVYSTVRVGVFLGVRHNTKYRTCTVHYVFSHFRKNMSIPHNT